MKTFELIIRFNILINNQRYIDSNVFYTHVLKARRVYQKLILYVIMITKDFDKKVEKQNENVKREDETLKTILSNAINSILKTKILLKIKRRGR